MVVKSVVLSVLAVVVIIALSACIGRPSASKKGLIRFGLLVAYLFLILSIGVPVATVAASVGGRMLGRIIGPLGFLGGMWFAAIVVQVAQNIGYRLVGAPTHKLRWYRSWKKSSKCNKSG
jgi:ABC-type Co2+ transport system permease subunit